VPAVTVRGDAAGLRQALIILLDNALKYGGQQIQVTAERRGKYAWLRVHDNGPGIARQDLPHIFERFYRADSSRSKAGTGGYGLGLSIARQIVAQHGGRLTAQSQPGTGATFIMKLPLALPAGVQ